MRLQFSLNQRLWRKLFICLCNVLLKDTPCFRWIVVSWSGSRSLVWSGSRNIVGSGSIVSWSTLFYLILKGIEEFSMVCC
jgi:hypothetical protein